MVIKNIVIYVYVLSNISSVVCCINCHKVVILRQTLNKRYKNIIKFMYKHMERSREIDRTITMPRCQDKIFNINLYACRCLCGVCVVCVCLWLKQEDGI